MPVLQVFSSVFLNCFVDKTVLNPYYCVFYSLTYRDIIRFFWLLNFQDIFHDCQKTYYLSTDICEFTFLSFGNDHDSSLLSLLKTLHTWKHLLNDISISKVVMKIFMNLSGNIFICTPGLGALQINKFSNKQVILLLSWDLVCQW